MARRQHRVGYYEIESLNGVRLAADETGGVLIQSANPLLGGGSCTLGADDMDRFADILRRAARDRRKGLGFGGDLELHDFEKA